MNTIEMINSITSWKFRWYLLLKMPSAFFMGFKVKSLSVGKGEVLMPFSWRSQNPFKSVYFACQSAAAELSTGILVLLHTNGLKVSMLVGAMKGEFHKKANQDITFICEDGNHIQQMIQKAIDTKSPVTIEAKTKGYLPNGVIVSEFTFTWSVLIK